MLLEQGSTYHDTEFENFQVKRNGKKIRLFQTLQVMQIRKLVYRFKYRFGDRMKLKEGRMRLESSEEHH